MAVIQSCFGSTDVWNPSEKGENHDEKDKDQLLNGLS
jgi:hypothetical protein